MPAPFFTENQGEFSRLEGVYIFEKDPPAFVQGVFLGVVGIAGQTLRGPVNTPIEITSQSRFEEIFGERSYEDSTVSVNKVREFLMNKPFGKVVVTRVAAAAATVAEADDAGGFVNVAASSPGAWGNDLTVEYKAATSGLATQFDMVIGYKGDEVTYKNLDVSAGNNNLLDVIGSDQGNLVVVTKLADGTPAVAAAAALADTAGADGTLAATDFTATGGAMEQIASYPGVAIAAVADGGSFVAAINAKTLLLAQASSDRIWLIWNGSHTADVATVAGDAASYRSDRIMYVYNSTKTFDVDLGAQVTVPPHSWVASIMSQTNVDINPGEEASKNYTGGISGLQSTALAREDYITLREAGVAAWERDFDGGHLIVSAVVTDLTPGKTEVTRRRMADFLQLSISRRLRYFVKKLSTVVNRGQMQAEVKAFMEGLKADGIVVEDYQLVTEGVNTAAKRAQGIECLLLRVKILGHMLHIVLKTEIGTTVEITEE